ncbi:MAG: DUF5696 domain-containing protein [Saccharofermentanales bacterium]
MKHLKVYRFLILMTLLAMMTGMAGACAGYSGEGGQESGSLAESDAGTGTENGVADDADAAGDSTAFVEYEDNTFEYSGYQVIADNGQLKLEFNGDNQGIKIMDLQNGYVWSSVYEESRLLAETNDYWLNNIKSPVQVMYINKDATVNDPQSSSLFGDINNTKVTKIENGMTLDVHFLDLMLAFQIRFEISGRSLIVTVPDDRIYELGDNRIVGIHPLPFFGAASDTDNGYFVYPGGMGELFRFKEKEKRLNSLQAYRLPVFSEDKVNVDDMETGYNPYLERPSVLFPYFGIKQDDNALVAEMLQGQFNGAINIVPSGVYVTANRIFFEFVYRNHYDAAGSSLNVNGTSSKIVTDLFDRRIIPGTRQASYTFLSQSEANYSGMAAVIREHLSEAGTLPDRIPENSRYPLAIDIYNGIVRNYVFFKEFIPLMTFRETGNFLQNVQDRTGADLIVTLDGWSTTGAGGYPYTADIPGKIGGAKELALLADRAEAGGYKLLLNANFVDLDKRTGGFNISTEAAIDNTFSQYTNRGENRFLMTPQASIRRNAALTSKAGKLGIDGISYEKFGEYIYSCANRSGASSREDAAKVYAEIISGKYSSKDMAEGYNAVSGGNTYALRGASLVKDLPVFTNMLPLSDEQIPFYPMILHSRIPYSTTPVNLFYDEDYQLLKLAEYGLVPSFKLTDDVRGTLRESGLNWLFSSRYTGWLAEIEKVGGMFGDELGSLYSQTMTRHEVLGDGVVKVTYEQDVLYINYGNAAATADGLAINPMSFIVARNKG